MKLTLQDISKRYATGWVIKDLSTTIAAGDKVAVTGANGSGKSTLMQIISGYLSSSKGEIIYEHQGKSINRDNIYKYVAISAAYMELDEELTIKEMYDHYKLFKHLSVNNLEDFLVLTQFEKQAHKEVRFFSSGMKQRLALGFAFIMDVPLLLLDEPTSFLDEDKKAWYAQMIQNYTQNKTVIIASNDVNDITCCTKQINL